MAGNVRAILAEFIATFAFVAAGAGAVCMDALSGGRLGLAGIALAHGLAAAALATLYGRASGAQFNPAVTVTLWANGRQNAIKSVFFVAAQLLGATMAGLFLKAVLHNRPDLVTGAPFLGACDLSGVGYKAGTLVEAVLTFLLVTGIYSTAIDAGGRESATPFAVGSLYAIGVLAAGPLTGAAMNPARAFGPAIVTGHWPYWWVYWVGPLAGAAGASLLYEYLYLERKSKP